MTNKVFTPPPEFSDQAHIKNMDQFKEIYDRSTQDKDAFWADIAERITWFKKWDKVSDVDFTKARIKWFEDGKLNVSYNCLDRHVEAGKGDRTALIWEGNNPEEDKHFTYQELLDEVQKFANVLKNIGVEKGDRVCMYMQMVPQLPIAMLACARIGAVHSIVFGAFSADSLRDRINDSECKVLITQDTGVRGTKQTIPMKSNADKAVAQTPSIEHVIVVQRTGESVEMNDERDLWWHEEMDKADTVCAPEEMDAEDPLFILYTSVPPASPKACSTPQAVIWYTHRTLMNSFLIIMKMIFIGALRISVGSRAIPILYMDPWPTAPRRSCLKVYPIILISAVSGT